MTEKDIVPELLELINAEFDNKVLSSEKIKKAVKILNQKKASFLNANDLAIEVGEILAEVFGEKITADILPDGRMYYNIAERILNPTLNKNYEIISEYTVKVQNQLNKQAKLGIKGISPPINQSRMDGLVERLANENEFDKIRWILQEPIINFSQSIVDEIIKANVEFQYKAGLKPKIIRKEAGNCCDWCKRLVGTYEYPDVPKDVYRRHRYCRCTLEYDPGDGKRRNVHTK